MTAKEYLLQIRRLDYKIRHRKAQYKKIMSARAFYTSPAVDGDRVKASMSGAGFTAQSDKYLDMALDIVRSEQQLIAERFRIIRQIESLGDHGEVLYLVYVEYKNLMQAAQVMGYSYSHTRHLHTAALAAFDRKYLHGTG